ncbi:MAG: glutamate carboxypeptidase [Plesiomonas sp.]|uniref:glutamate carboxypeptidase n=1 Tax=Plesiomonas sp. TaxID=2486279 RepID=UPI003EE66197
MFKPFVRNKMSAGITTAILATFLCGTAYAYADVATEVAPVTAVAAAASPDFAPQARSVDQALLAAATTEQAATLKTLEQLVKIETGTGDDIGMPQMSALLAKELKKLGATVTLHKAEAGVVGDNVVGEFHGKGDKNLLLMAHMDTVYPRGTLAKTPWRIEGNKAYGPGVADAKSGITVILHSLQLLKDRNFNDYGTITVLFNTDEEKGSHGSKALIESLAAKSDAIFSYEPTLADSEAMPLNTSGIGAINVSVKGLAAHAGANPELGVNALIEASDFALRTMDLDQGPGKLRLTWTHLDAGSVNNIVPDSAKLYADVRYPTKAAFEQLTRTLQARSATKRVPNAEVSFDFNPGRPPYNAGAGGSMLIQNAVDIYHSLGHKITVVPVTGGGTDAGYAMKSGKPIIEGMGLPGFGYHANVGEWVVIDSIPRRLYLSAQMIMDIAQGK